MAFSLSEFKRLRLNAKLLLRLDNATRKTFLLQGFLISVFLDFPKAYNMLWTSGLPLKLDSIGVKGNIVGFIRSFFFRLTLFRDVYLSGFGSSIPCFERYSRGQCD